MAWRAPVPASAGSTTIRAPQQERNKCRAPHLGEHQGGALLHARRLTASTHRSTHDPKLVRDDAEDVFTRASSGARHRRGLTSIGQGWPGDAMQVVLDQVGVGQQVGHSPHRRWLTSQWPQKKRVAIITGAGSDRGIGFAAARLLGIGGNDVVLTSTTDRIFKRVDELRAAGIRAEGVVADLTDQAGVDAAVACATDRFGGVDILVNNAGMTAVSDARSYGGSGRTPVDHWHASLDRNLTTMFLTTRAVTVPMQTAGYGR